jgi:hypothetical protein
MWSVRISLKRKDNCVSDVAEIAIAEMKRHAPKYPAIRRAAPAPDTDSFAYEISVPDLHAGKLAWWPETGENWDTKLAQKAFTDAVVNLAARVRGQNVAEIWLPLGNDFFHVDTIENTTTAGTRQDVDSRWQKSFLKMKGTVIEAIDFLREIAPVKVVVVPGNHDRSKMFFFGDTLVSWYAQCPDVTIDNSPTLRKYLTFGRNLVGFTHGSEERHADLPLIMAQEMPEAWAATRQREWHVGHMHKRKAQHFTAGDTHQGVVVRTLPALCGTDSWHASKGYVKGPRAAEAYQWSFEHGYAGHLSYNHWNLKPAAQPAAQKIAA